MLPKGCHVKINDSNMDNSVLENPEYFLFFIPFLIVEKVQNPIDLTNLRTKHKFHPIKTQVSSNQNTSVSNQNTNVSNQNTSVSNQNTSVSNQNTSASNQNTSVSNKTQVYPITSKLLLIFYSAVNVYCNKGNII